MGDYHRLRVWRLSHDLTLQVYRLTLFFPDHERYGLISQIRRSAASIPANLAEGCGRDTDPELVRFARIALGSANELEYHLLLARDLEYLSHGDHSTAAATVSEVKRMLAGLASSVSRERSALTTDD